MARTPITLESDLAGEYPKKFNKRELKLAEAIRQDKNIEDSFEAPLVWSAVDQEGALLATSTPAAGDEIAFISSKNTYLAHVQSINGTAVHSFPFVSADGLEINVDDNATDGITGWEITNGILGNSKAAYTVGSFPQGKTIYLEANVLIDDISDVTELAIGFRKAEAFQVAVDNYDEMAAFNIGADGDGQIEIHTILNNAATAETDTTETDWADGKAYKLRIEVANDGACSFLITDAAASAAAAEALSTRAPAATQAFSFDSGEVIVPFLFLACETGDPGVSISSWKCGVK